MDFAASMPEDVTEQEEPGRFLLEKLQPHDWHDSYEFNLQCDGEIFYVILSNIM